jgi:hypothetical protein
MIWERRLYALLTFLLCLPAWLVSTVPSQDGPAHAYNARVLWDLVTHSSSIYREWYVLTPGLTTNLSAHVLLAGLSAALPAPYPEKILVTLCIVLMAAGLRYAATAVHGGGGFLAVLALPATTGVLLHLGFYSFQLAVGLFCFAIGYWFRRWGTFTILETLAFCLLTTALFVSHIMPWLVLLLVIGVPALWLAVRRSAMFRYLLPTSIALLPSFVLLLIYAAHAQEWTAGTWFPKRKLLDLLSDNPIVALSNPEVFVFVALCAITALLVLVVVRDRLFRRYLSPYDWLAPLSVFLFLLFVAAPSGALGGGYLRPRLWLLSAFTLLFWLSSNRFHPRDRALVSAFAALITVGSAWGQWKSQEGLQPYLNEVVAARRVIPDGHTILNLRYSQAQPTKDGRALALRVDPFLQAGALAAHVPGVVWINNYEASTGHFPLSWRPGLDVKQMGTIDSEPPCVDILGWQSQTGRSIDYVMLLGYPPPGEAHGCGASTLHQVEEHYRLIYKSDTSFVTVWRKPA